MDCLAVDFAGAAVEAERAAPRPAGAFARLEAASRSQVPFQFQLLEAWPFVKRFVEVLAVHSAAERYVGAAAVVVGALASILFAAVLLDF